MATEPLSPQGGIVQGFPMGQYLWFGLPLEYWTVKGLSAVASGTGKPLYPDRRIIEKTRIGCARVCIEVSASNELMRELEVCDKNGNSFTVYTEYDWAPEVCSSCQCFGHSTVACGKIARLNPTIEKNQKSSAEQDGWNQIQRRRKENEPVMELVLPPLILKSSDEPNTAELQVGNIIEITCDYNLQTATICTLSH